MAQNFNNHRRFNKAFHFVLIPVALIAFINSVVKVVIEPSYLNFSISLLFFLVILSSVIARTSALKAQDRAIINEVKLRYFLLSGKAINGNLKKSQLIALRFAPDTELMQLAELAITENLSATAIKKGIRNWNPDYHRV